jgi:sulfatase maturation enzyme AslB (radical SAM superfamily)
MVELGTITSLCEHCYRHVPASRFEKDNSIWIKKTCPEHGVTEYMIERDAEFYHALTFDPYGYDVPSGIMIEVTDRCNLQCPHCYHEPENKTSDKPADLVLSQIESWPADAGSVILAGAEPTLRKDLPDLIRKIIDLQTRTGRTHQDVTILTNGVRLSDRDFVKAIKEAGCRAVMIGLNHPSYQGDVVHNKQLAGIQNCIDEGIIIYYIGYTIESYDHLPFILDEIQKFGNTALQYRIRAGSDIGRNPDEPRVFLSDNVAEIKKISDANNWTWEKLSADDNIYHYMVKINGITHRIIQWCDVKNIDIDELRCGPWSDFVPGKPMSNLLHQIILRDAAVNKSMTLWDTVPKRYQYRTREQMRLDP